MFEICDPSGACDSAPVTITVFEVNDPPTADSLNTTVPEGTPTTISLSGLDPEGDPILFQLLDGPTYGTISGFDPISGDLIYTADSGYTGPDSFTFEVCDPFGMCDQGTIQLLVTTVGGGARVECDPRLVISEIAWAGTAANSDHEWIELRSLEADEIDLSGWTLRWRRKRPETAEDRLWKAIRLEGVIGPAPDPDQPLVQVRERGSASLQLERSIAGSTDGFYLLERRVDDVVSDTAADQVYDDRLALDRILDLDDAGEIVELIDPTGCVVDTANADDSRRDGWISGDALHFATMERTEPDVDDIDENWHTNLGAFQWGRAADDEPLLGTARTHNSPNLDELLNVTDVPRISETAGESIRAILAQSGDPGEVGPYVVMIAEPLEFDAKIASRQQVVGLTIQQGIEIMVSTAGLPRGDYVLLIHRNQERAWIYVLE